MMMSMDPEESAARLRREGADAERSAIIAIVERHIRLLAHGHGANGAQVLQHLLSELEDRDPRSSGGDGDPSR
ncbi:hypothetical protein BH23GEM6_BH23GEM6_21130 [soil metagenome]